jgi:ABC-type transport system involved in cytochrome c biogenesis permease subunit
MDWSLILLRAALLIYILGFLATFVPLLTGVPRPPRLTGWLVGAGAVLHTAAVVALGVRLGRCPLETLPEVLSAVAWASVLVYLGVAWRYRLAVLHLIVLPMVLVVLFISNLLPPGFMPVSEGLRVPALRIHLTAIILAVAGLLVTFAASLVYVLVDRTLKLKRPTRFFMALPSLEKCDAIGQASLLWAFPLLTFGIITGAIVSASLYGTFWTWQPRENLAILAWAILASVVVARVGWGWRGRKPAILTLFGVCALLLRMIGVYLGA